MVTRELHLVFHGNVQGVGFRATARRKAQELGLTGIVRNLADGSVELIAQGKEEELKSLVQFLHHHFAIEKMKEKYLPVTQTYQGFTVS